MNQNWNPDQYLKFAGPRRRPAVDLINRLAADCPGTVYDLGCGPGEITRILAERWPAAAITGIDNSPAMLARAAEGGSAIEWVEADIAAWSPPGPADLIFSNAALHWLDDHKSLFPKLFSMLAGKGVLAVQMPRNHAAPSHRLMAEAAGAGPWADTLAPLLREDPVEKPRLYYDLLAPHAAAVDIWQTDYTHILEGRDPVLEWLRGTALKPLLDALDETGNTDWKDAFVGDLSGRLNQAYPMHPNGRTLFSFRRLFVVATTPRAS